MKNIPSEIIFVILENLNTDLIVSKCLFLNKRWNNICLEYIENISKKIDNEFLNFINIYDKMNLNKDIFSIYELGTI